MNPLLHLLGNVVALALGVLSVAFVARAVRAYVSGDRRLLRTWLLRAAGAGLGCLGVAAMFRQAAGA